MADVVGILSFALHAAHKVYDIVDSIRDAPGDIQALRDDALQVHGFLDRVLYRQDGSGQSSPLRIGNIDGPQLNALLKRAQNIKTTVDRFISKTTTQRDDGTYQVKKLKWPLHTGEAKKLSKQFKAFYLSLTAVYTVSTSVTVDAVSSRLNTQQASLEHQKAMLTAIYAAVTLQRAAREKHQGRDMRTDEITATPARSSSDALTNADPYASSSMTDGEGQDADPATAVENGANAEAAVGSEVDVSREIPHASDLVITSPSSTLTNDGSSFVEQYSNCLDDCMCDCHSDIRPIPALLRPWLGKLNIPRAVAASLLPSVFPCNDVHCTRNPQNVRTVRYYPPVWFAYVEAVIRFEALPIHFCIQTPRIVASLRHLRNITFDEFKRKLSLREITLHDVEPNGFTILHQLLLRGRVEDAFDMISFVLKAGIPRDWQYGNMIPVEWAAHVVQLNPALRIDSSSLDLNIVRPLLHSSLDEAFQTLDEKLKRTDLHSFLLRPHHDAAQSLDILRAMLTLPGISAQLNGADLNGMVPLDYARRAFPEAVELLLRAGANPAAAHEDPLHQTRSVQWKAVSALVRAGCDMGKRHKSNLGRSVLHYAATVTGPQHRCALELMRHGGHRLDWNACDDNGDTPLDIVERLANREPDDEQLTLIRELYRAQSIPRHARFMSSFDNELLIRAEEAAARPRISLIDTCLAGDTETIGRLISAGAMANERDDEGHTLLHLIAMGDRVPDAYRVALELERHARHGIDHEAIYDGKTARDMAKETLRRDDLDDDAREDVKKVLAYLEDPRLPPGEQYVFPCMDPNFCKRCSSLRCSCVGYDVPHIPGTFKS